MLSKILNIGINDSLDIEERAKVKLQNAMAALGFLINVFFIFYHLFYTHKTNVSIILFVISFIAPLVFVFHKNKNYLAAKIALFLFLYILIFAVSTILLVGHGNEYYYISLSILILVLNKNHYWIAIIILFNIFLFLLPHYFYPNKQEEFIVSTHIAVYVSALLSVMFFINLQNKFRVKLKEQKIHLEKLNEEKNDLIGIVAHDLKSPLAQIQGLLNILTIDKSALNSEQVLLIEKIQGVTNNQRNQITKFLNVKAVEDAFSNPTLQIANVNTIVSSVIEQFKPIANAKNIQIKPTLSKEELTVLEPPEGLAKIVSNLLSNAIKYSFQNSVITIQIQAEAEADQILILIKDQGQGFKKEELPLVFAKNKVLSALPTAKESASGVGLFIVKKYVEMMNGKVWLESEEGVGSTFFVQLPKA